MKSNDILLLASALAALTACGPAARSGTYAAAAPAVKEGDITTSDGVRIHYRQVGTRGDTLVFLHGGPGGNYLGHGPDIERFGERHVLIMYDQRGGGHSELVDSITVPPVGRHVQDLEEVRRHFGIGRLNLLGNSWGSGLAVLYAAEYPQHVGRLILWIPMPPARVPFVQQRADAQAARRQALLAATGLSLPDDAEREAAPVSWCRRLLAVELRVWFADTTAIPRKRGDYCRAPAEALRRMFMIARVTLRTMGDWDFRPILRRLNVPVLVIEGGETFIPREYLVPWAAEPANGRLLLIPGAGHGTEAVERPDLFFPAIERFIRGEWPEGAERPTVAPVAHPPPPTAMDSGTRLAGPLTLVSCGARRVSDGADRLQRRRSRDRMGR